MTIQEWLEESQNKLQHASILTARLDCLILLGDDLGYDKAWLLSHPEHEIQGSIIKNLDTKIAQRAKHIPLAYIRGHSEFYGREFSVNEHVLVPRPETEAMIEMVKRVRNMEAAVAATVVVRRGRKPTKKQYAFEKNQPKSSLVKTEDGYKVVWQKQPREQLTQPPAPIQGQSLNYHDEDFHFIDIGTGSGAIAITTKLEAPDAIVSAVDIDETCLDIAQKNAAALDADITFRIGNLLKPYEDFRSDQCVVLLCNLPYVPKSYPINNAATHEPRLALFGGTDGLGLYRELFGQIQSYAWKPAYIITESLPEQHEALTAIAEATGYTLHRTDDFIQLFSLA